MFDGNMIYLFMRQGSSIQRPHFILFELFQEPNLDRYETPLKFFMVTTQKILAENFDNILEIKAKRRFDIDRLSIHIILGLEGIEEG